MGIMHLLPDFAGESAGAPLARPLEEEPAAERLAAFEEGYKAGWDDAWAAQAEDRGRLSEELARNLQDLSFTYHEAQAQFFIALRPLLDRIVAALLPAMAREALAPRLVEELEALSRQQTDVRAHLRVSPGQLARVQDALGEAGFPLDIAADETLGEGQAQLRLGAAEREIDLDGTLARMAEAVASFFHQTEREARHG